MEKSVLLNMGTGILREKVRGIISAMAVLFCGAAPASAACDLSISAEPETVTLCYDKAKNYAKFTSTEVYITTSDPADITWTKNGVAVTGAETQTIADTGKWVVTAKAGDCIVTKTFDIQLPGELTIEDLSEKICSGESFTATASGMKEGTYVWTSNRFDEPVEDATALILKDGTYTVKATDELGCTMEKKLEIEMKHKVTATVDGNLALCPGQTETVIEAVVEPIEGISYSYSWIDLTEGKNCGTTAKIIAHPLHTYVVDILSSEGCSGRSSASIVYVSVDNLKITFGVDTIYFCSKARNTITAPGVGFVGYEWEGNGETDPNNSQYYTVNGDGKYTVAGVTSSGCTGPPTEFYVKILDAPSVIINKIYPCSDAPAYIEAYFSDKENTNYKFFWDDDSNNPKRMITQSGTYEATYIDRRVDPQKTTNVACIAKNSVTVDFIDPPTIELSQTKAQICEGEKLTVFATTVGTGDPETYEWRNEKGEVLGTDSVLTVSIPGIYTFKTKTNKEHYECENEATVEVELLEAANATVEDPGKICEGKDVTLVARDYGEESISWGKVDDATGEIVELGTEETLAVDVAGKYVLTAITPKGCVVNRFINVENDDKLKVAPVMEAICDGETGTIELTSQTPFTCEWPDETTEKTHTFTTGETITVNLRNSESGCESSLTFSTVVYPVPTGKIVAPEAICDRQSAEAVADFIVADGEMLTYLWDNGDNTAATKISDEEEHSVTVTTENLCKTEAKVKLKVNPLPVFTLDKDGDNLCMGELSVLSAICADAGTEFEWQLKGKKVGEGKTFDGTVGTYAAIGTNALGCRDTVEITVNNKSDLTVEAQFDPICDGEEGVITIVGEPSTMVFTNKWLDNNSEERTHTFTTNDNLLVEINEPISGCVSVMTVEPIVNPNPVGRVTAVKGEFCEGTSARVLAEYTVESGEEMTYAWDNGYVSRTGLIRDADLHTVVVTTESGCTAIGSVQLTMIRRPVITMDVEPKGICIGDEVTITVDGTDKYFEAYTDYQGVEITSGAKIRPNETGNVEIMVYGQDLTTKCYSATEVVTIEVSPHFDLGVDGKDYICFGTTRTVTATGADRYVWGYDGAESDIAEQTFAKTTAYTLKGERDDSYCTENISGVMTLLDKIEVVTKAKTTICENATVDLTAESADAASYEWRKEGSEEIVGTRATYTAEASGKYTVKAVTAKECRSDAYTVDVEQVYNPVVTISGKDFVCADSTNLLTAVATGTAPLTYLWSEGGTEEKMDAAHAGTYSVRVTDGNNCHTDAETTLTLRSPQLTIEGPSQFCTDSVLTLKGEGMTEYYWDGEGRTATNNKQTKKYAEGGIVKLTAYDEEGCKATAVRYIVKRPVPTLTMEGETEFCEEGSTVVIPRPSVMMKRYVWDGEEQTTAAHTIDKEKAYKVRAYDTYNCPTEEYVTMGKMIALPIVKIKGDDYVCEGMSGKDLIAQSETAERYEWNTGEEKDTIHINETGKYEVWGYVKECKGHTVEIEVSESKKPDVSIEGDAVQEFCHYVPKVLTAVSETAVEYSWDFGAFKGETLTTEKDGKHTVTAIDAKGCAANASVTLTELFGPKTLTIGGVSKVCEYSKALLIAECKDCEKLLWSNGSTEDEVEVGEEGDYYVVGYSEKGCPSDTARERVKIMPAPAVLIFGETELMNEDETTLTAEASGDAPFKYIWMPTKEKTASITVKGEDIDLLEKYGVTAIDKNGCPANAMVELRKVAVKVRGKRDICVGESTTIEIVGNDAKSAEWSNGATGLSAEFDTEGVYTVSVTLKNGDIENLKFSIKLHELPTVDVFGDESFCSGDEVKLTARSADTLKSIVWNTGKADSVITVRESGDYTATATSIYGCVGKATKSVKKNELPDVKIVGASEIVEEEPIFLTAEGANTYLWIESNETSQKIEVSEPGTYRLYGKDNNGCWNFDTHEVVFVPIPHPLINNKINGEAIVCEGDSIELIASGGTTYTWDNGKTGESVFAKESRQYTVSACLANGQCREQMFNVTVVPRPKLEKIDGARKVCPDGSSALTVTTLGNDMIENYVWSTGEQTESVTATEEGEYSVYAISEYGCHSDTLTAKIEYYPTLALAFSGARELCDGSQTVINASGALTYKWQGTDNETNRLTASESGVYKLSAWNEFGCQTDSVISIVTLGSPTIKIIGDGNICEGETRILKAGGDKFSENYYRWSDGSEGETMTATHGGQYSLTLSNRAGCEATAEFTLTDRENPRIVIDGKRDLCVGDERELMITKISGNGLTAYDWSNGEHTVSTIVRAGGRVTAIATDEYGCRSNEADAEIVVHELPNVEIAGAEEIVEEEKIFLTASGAQSYEWMEFAQTLERVEVNAPGSYHVWGTDEFGCRNVAVHDVALVSIPCPLINNMSDGMAVICEGEEYILIASGAKTYIWDNGETTDAIKVKESRKYTVKGCLENGQCREQTFSIEVQPRPKMSMIMGDKMFCPEGSTMLTAKTNADATISHFTWNTGEQTNTIRATKADTYSVWATSNFGCVSDTMEVTTSLFTPPTLAIDGAREICDGASVTLLVSGAERYEWVGKDNTTERITATEAGAYTVRGWDEHGCKTDSTIVIRNLGTPNIVITGDANICAGEERTLTAGGDKFANTIYRWSTGDNKRTTKVTEGGEYSVIVSNDAGCEGRADFVITERENPVIAIEGKREVCQGFENVLTVVQKSGNVIKDYEWSNGEKTQKIEIGVDADFAVVATDEYGCKSNMAEAKMKVIVPNPTTVGGDFHICTEMEDTTKVTALCEGATAYNWINMESGDTLEWHSAEVYLQEAGKYRAVATDRYGCKSRHDFAIIGHKNPVVFITGAETPVCGPEEGLLTAKSEGEQMSFVWGEGQKGETLKVSENGKYSVYGTDKYGCVGTATADFVINDIPGLTAKTNYSFCPGENVTIALEGAEEYLWSNGGRGNTQTFNTPTAAFVIGKDIYGCEKKLDFSVTEFETPKYSISAIPSKIKRTESNVHFHFVTDYDMDRLTLLWNLGGGDEVEASEFDYTFDASYQLRFPVVLRVETLDGCHTETKIVIENDLDIPNAITPNGDGKNDVFMRGCKVEIKDRHGSLIHKGDNGWDGRLRNGDITKDTYYYILTDADGEKHYGYVTVR